MEIKITIPQDIYTLDRRWIEDIVDVYGGTIVSIDKLENPEFRVLFFWDEGAYKKFAHSYPLIDTSICT
jgi:hypothetical protein